MNIDFTAVKDARLGTDKIKRIYQGEKLVWNKYNWEKFDCIKESQTVAGLKKVGTSSEPSTNRTSGRFYKRISGYYFWGILFADETEVANYPLKDLYNEGYRYYNVGSGIYGQNAVAMYSSFQELAGIQNGRMQINVYEAVPVDSGETVYVKGDISYGIVNGNPGDYPANGRHSDGYWYVSKGAIGYPAEEGENT